MCLVKMKVEHDDDPPTPPRRIVVRPASQTSHSHSHPPSHRSSRIILEPQTSSHHPTAVRYITSTTTAGPNPYRLSNPRIVYAHAPSPPRSPHHSHTSMHSSHSHSYSRRNSISGSPRASGTRVVEYVSAPAPRHERTRSGQYLTTAAAALGGREDIVDGIYGESARQSLFLEDGGPVRRSITYATTGPRLSRERVVIEEAGRRRESYRPIG